MQTGLFNVSLLVMWQMSYHLSENECWEIVQQLKGGKTFSSCVAACFTDRPQRPHKKKHEEEKPLNLWLTWPKSKTLNQNQPEL